MGGTQHHLGLISRRVLRPGDAEIHHLHVAVWLDHDVLRLHIPVDDVLLMGSRERLADLSTDLGHSALIESASLLDSGLQVRTADVFHDNVIGIIIMTPVVDVHDIGALEIRGCSGFLAEAPSEIRIIGILRKHHLDGDHATEGGVSCCVDLGHPADADTIAHFIAPREGAAGHGAFSSHVDSLGTHHLVRLRCVSMRAGHDTTPHSA